MKARILLAENRGVTTFKGLDSYHYFNFGKYRMEGREPFGEFLAVNLDVLSPEISFEIDIDSPREIILIPIAGGIEITLSNEGDPYYISTGEVVSLSGQVGSTVRIANPYPDERVMLLQVWLKYTSPDHDRSPVTGNFNFELKNELLPVFLSRSDKTKACIARMDLREEGLYRPERPDSDLLVITIAGAFEFQERLLQPGDGLILQEPGMEIEFEALSQDAIVLLMETS